MAETPTKRSAGRPRTRVLSVDQIVDAAFELARTAGPDGFTMAALARSLSVQPPALYHYFGGKGEVIRAMRGRLAGPIDTDGFADPDVPLDEAVSRWGRTYRDVFAAFPSGITLLATTPVDGQQGSVDNYEAISRRLIDEGWAERDVVDTIVAFESFIIGSSLDALAPADIMSPGDAAATAPVFAAAEALRARETAARGIRPTDRSFDLGLRAMLAGLRPAPAPEEPTSPSGSTVG
ncbi:TetR/AcrR family transcriptional regulator [Agromyces allii]|uniref:HTH tetR-type domain-containing protein n=1 Tax=Agromyces allii TaxID=393607 RepID=A0ABN2QC64_9MICO|nr:TetR/AcrR family transcriptional regulator [Agromyces allii]